MASAVKNEVVNKGVQRISRADARFVLALVSVVVTGILLVAGIEIPDQWWLIITMVMVWYFTSRHNDVKAPQGG